MNIVGIRRAKATLSELVRDAAKGKCSLVTDNRKPVAMIGPPPGDYGPESQGGATEAPPLLVEGPLPSDPAAFLDALRAAPHPLELDF